jgi:glucokinase
MNLAIGIDLGGTSIKCGLIDPNGKIIWNRTEPTEAGQPAERTFTHIRSVIHEAITFEKRKHVNIQGIGIGIPGIIEEGILVGGANNLPGWGMVPIKTMLEKEFDRQVYVENDANLMGLAESRFGSARGVKHVIFLTIGTGIGGAMILNGRLYGGYHNRGGEFGHIIIQEDGRPCSCGSKGCFEQYASTGALINDYRCLINPDTIEPDQEIDGKFIVEKYLENDVPAVQAMNQHFDHLAAGISSLINIFAPEKIVVGGGISEAGDFYIENIRQRVFRIAMKETSSNTKIERASLGNNAGMLGAAILVFDY